MTKPDIIGGILEVMDSMRERIQVLESKCEELQSEIVDIKLKHDREETYQMEQNEH